MSTQTKNQKHQSGKSVEDFLATFVRLHKKPRTNQAIVIPEMSENDALVLQAPTGSGKTALGYTFLETNCGEDGNGFYVCPSKTLVDHVVQLYPEAMAMYGRNEYPCLYYDGEYKADEIPCSMLKECPHRVNLETGETFISGAKPCPYFQAKYESRQAKVVVSTMQYYFFEALGRETLPTALVVDEVHEWSNSIRNMLSYKITDHRLEEFWELLHAIGCTSEAKLIRSFQYKMMDIIRSHTKSGLNVLIQDESLKVLLRILLKIESNHINTKIKKAISEKKIDIKADRELLRELDIFTNDLSKYIRSLEFSLATENRRPLSFVYGYWDRKVEEGKKIKYSLTVQSYSIAGLTRKMLTPEKNMVMSATIGSTPAILNIDAGFDGKFIDLKSDFPIENTAIFMPDDLPDLSVKGMRGNDKNRTIRKMLQGAKKGIKNGIRSLIIVISEEERQKCLAFAKEEGVNVISYDSESKPREIVQRFRDGEGDVLLGTEAQYGQGIDLPGDICGFVFYLRPGYPRKDDPQAQFEARILGNQRWALWTWRVINKVLQARGRNVRSAMDKGCIFLMSAQFKRFTYGGLPEWLRPAYVGQISFDKAIQQGINLLKK